MIRLDSTLRKLEAVLSGAVATTQPSFVASWSDASASDYIGGVTPGNLNGVTPVTLVAAPAASTVRDVDCISFVNKDTAIVTLTVNFKDNATLYPIFKAVLAIGDVVTYTHGDGWKVTDSLGNTKTSGISGASSVQVLGLSSTASENHFWDGSIANILTLKRGIPSAPGAEVMNVASGQVSFPNQIVPAYYAAWSGTVGSILGPLLLAATEILDTDNAYSAGRFTPQVAGWYQVNASAQFQCGTALSFVLLGIKKNTNFHARTVVGPYATNYAGPSIASLVYLNGTTDYIEIWQDIGGTGAASVLNMTASACLVRRG